mmetsp:Transcript_59764/g.87564  ORF Transcript_59764/g.87564 Transcript_59764/m.87564 type:complete len:551 (+) Transcript_59764:36-1688(+)
MAAHSYGSVLPCVATPPQHQGARTRRNVLVAVGTLCVVAAAVAVSTLHTYQRQNVLFQMPTETQALAELSKSDMMLASSAPKAAPQLQSAAVLKKAAEMLEKNQEARIKKAAAKLQQEETQEGEVKTAAAKLLAEARHEEQKQNSAKVVAQQKAAVEAQFTEGKERILAEAAAAISKAEAKKNKMENAMGQKLGANDDAFLNLNPPLNPPEQYDPFSNMDPPIVKKAGRAVLKDSDAKKVPEVPNAAAGKALAADEQVSDLEKELTAAKAKAAMAEHAMVQHLSGANGDEPADPSYATGSEGADWKPTYYEDYYPGRLGPMGESKRIPEDHPKGHKNCRFHDIDCDELWPWGKKKIAKDEPPQRFGKLGDNMVGVFGQDDVVVPTEDSGLIAHAKPYVDQFDHWPEDSKKNKDLLYGNARQVISQKYAGVGDVYVPLQRLQKMESQSHPHGQPLADLLFGSWQQGFVKPHDTAIRKNVNMFDQPYRQHFASATGQGHQIYKLEPKHDISEQYGGPLSMGPTKGDDEDWVGHGAKEEDADSPSNLGNAFAP